MRATTDVTRLVVAACAAAVLASAPASAATLPDQVGVQVVARTSAQIGAPMSGTLATFPLVDGSSFAAGDVLATFQCTQQAANLARAKAGVLKANGVLSTQRQLRALETYSKVEYSVAVADAQAAAAELAVAEAAVSFCTVKAPFSGHVSGVDVHDHQYVQAGAPMLEILDDTTLELEAIIPSAWLSWVSKGTPVTVDIAETGKSYQARVDRVSARVDPVSRTVKVYAVLDGEASSRPNLLAGMSGTARFQRAP